MATCPYSLSVRCYLSRCECNHTVPSIETLEKWAHALGVPLYQVFFEANDQQEPESLKLPKVAVAKLSGKDASLLTRLGGFVSKMADRDKKLLVGFAHKLATR